MDPVAIALTTVGWLMSTLISKAITALLEEWAKRVGLGNEFITLKEELTQINCTLGSARGLQTKNEALRKLLQDLQQLAYEADDLLDELDYYRIQDDIELYGGNQRSQIAGTIDSSTSSSSGFKLASHGILSIFKKGSCSSSQDFCEQLHSSLPNRITMSRRMNELVAKLKENNSSLRKALKLETIATIRKNFENQAIRTNPCETTSRMIERVFGRDQEHNNLINLIVGEEAATQTLSVVAIVGHGGVGKTTLARSVYNDKSRVNAHFMLKMWITVSVNFDVKRITREILQCASGNDYKNIENLDKLQTTLEESLQERRFLLVLDDLWEDEDTNRWELLLAPLKNSLKTGNVVLVTTRIPGIRKLDSTITFEYLNGLGEGAYWSLLKAHAFSHEMHEEHPNLQDIGRHIIRKLKGNPLAAKTVGALLKKDLSERHWRTVLESEEWKHDASVNSIMPALRISYDYLLPHLQCCFSYCALFPKDFVFPQESIVNLWIAQSFIHDHDQRKRLEDVGKKYLDDLVDFGFLQRNDEEDEEDEEDREYVMHDLLHDLAQNVSSEECASNLDGQEIQEIPHTIRHLSIFVDSENNLIKVENHLKAGKLRTLVISIHDNIIKRIEGFPGRLKDARGLRVLISSDIYITITLLRIPLNFTHLRYLDLCSDSTTLPGEICYLYHLQVLDVHDWVNLKELPNNFSDLINLRHFIVRKNMQDLHSLIAGVGKLSQLQELNRFRVGKEIEFAIEQLRGLNELGGQLSICSLENVESTVKAESAGLSEKSFLKGLHLSWDRVNSGVGYMAAATDTEADVLNGLCPHQNLERLAIIRYGGVSSPGWMTWLICLEEVHLQACVGWEILPPLGQLPSLKRLYLISMPAIKEIGRDFYGNNQCNAFQCLKEMKLKDLPNLAKWHSKNQRLDLPALLKLSVIDCPELELSWSALCFDEKVCVTLENIKSVEYFYLSTTELVIFEPRDSNTWGEVNLHDLRAREITLLEIRSNPYSLTWDNLLNLGSLKTLIIIHCSVLFSLPHNPSYNQRCRIKELSFSNSGITGKQLTCMLQHMPELSDLELRDCHEIKSIAVATEIDEPSSTASPSIEFEEDEGLLQFPSSLSSLRNLKFNMCPYMVLARNKTLSGLVSVQRLELRYCRSLLYHLDLEQSMTCLLPPGLQELEMDEMPDGESHLLKGLSSLIKLNIRSSTLKFLDVTSCASLEKLKLNDCYMLASLNGMNSLTCMKYLEFRSCPELKSLDFTSCTALEELTLSDCEVLASINGLKSLTRLKLLKVLSCPRFAGAWISASEKGFSMALECLIIDSFANVAVSICGQLTSLQQLRIVNEATVGMTEQQEEALVLLTSLKEITFESCRNLQRLPAKLHQIHTLEKLEIYLCINIQSLPENGLPKSLRSLKVYSCGPEVTKLFKEYECGPGVEKDVWGW